MNESKPKIVVLDGYALNPGDLDYAPLSEFGTLEVYDRCEREDIPRLAADAKIILGNKIEMGEAEFRLLPRLKYIGVQATGYNLIDTAAARHFGIVVTNIPAYSTQSVAQLTFAHILNLSFHLSQHAQGVRDGRWSRNPDFCYWDAPLVELAGKTLGLVGFGNIAKKVAQIALAFDMRVVATRRNKDAKSEMNVEMVSLEEVFRESDVVSLHCPATKETTHLVDAQRLGWMKPSALLINTARGALIDEQALADALHSGRIGGAGLDVLSSEPPAPENPLLSAPNCFITPHFAWGTFEARRRCMEISIANVRAFVGGAPQNVVNGE
ncbi:MAG: D-2-hydroxyacid dehydrogenase [Planctomycetia bacterium]|nr:D-2-hydroxyacid dehydrogenase [Planctomycetia bacterium]